jgi:rhodanese-related sulfurtransferase
MSNHRGIMKDGLITPDELRGGAYGELLIFDIRKEPDDRQIPGSIRFDGEALANAPTPPFSKDERVVLYCGRGNSSNRIAAQLRERGYNAVALDGGFTAWKNSGFETEPIADEE